MFRHLKTTHIIVLAAVVTGCGESQDPPGDEPAYVEAVCGNPSAKILCRASVEGIEAHIEEFGPIQEEMEEVYLTDFDPNDTELLKVITKVDRLNVQLADNTDMTFISNLQEARRVRINKNSNLVSLRGLEKLMKVGDDVELKYNPSLESLDGLNGLRTIGDGEESGSLFIFQNERLKDISGLGSLESVRGIVLQNNVMMTTPGTLPSLTSLGHLHPCSVKRMSRYHAA